jgi:hypothetical protein
MATSKINEHDLDPALVLPIEQGGTGADNATDALTNLGASPTGHNHSASEINSGTLGVGRGGTGATSFTSGTVLIGNGSNAVTTRSITNNTSATASISANTNLITSNTLRYAMNRTTGLNSEDTNYSTSMVRGIKASTTDLTAGTSTLTSGSIYIVYE